MVTLLRRTVLLTLASAALGIAAPSLAAGTFKLEEATLSDIDAAMDAGDGLFECPQR